MAAIGMNMGIVTEFMLVMCPKFAMFMLMLRHFGGNCCPSTMGLLGLTLK